ncbi:hypothetical protein [Paenibacillus thiaminolyticus]|uniref:hypothetical protein n=1 Tax=Paenibacillus thiaminolyticus TaxID=49283 RepID=UPI0021C2929F|nr:hypothetical protein [Paenibacillus thiaminolyticus]CAH8720994.1 hypothetical protein KYE0_005868 [Paenibacillus thiaminolyticus]
MKRSMLTSNGNGRKAAGERHHGYITTRMTNEASRQRNVIKFSSRQERKIGMKRHGKSPVPFLFVYKQGKKCTANKAEG